jgi:hypothetical protein
VFGSLHAKRHLGRDAGWAGFWTTFPFCYFLCKALPYTTYLPKRARAEEEIIAISSLDECIDNVRSLKACQARPERFEFERGATLS